MLDAVKDPVHGYYDPRDPMTASVPKALVPDEPYASFVARRRRRSRTVAKPLAGMRIAILREHMVKRTKNHEAISDQIDAEIKAVLRDQLGAELVETVTPGYADDPARAERRVHVRRRAVGDPAALHAGDLRAPQRRRASSSSPCRVTT